MLWRTRSTSGSLGARGRSASQRAKSLLTAVRMPITYLRGCRVQASQSAAHVGGSGVSCTVTHRGWQANNLLVASWRTFRTHRRRRPRRQ